MEPCFSWLPLLAEKNLAYVFLIAAILVATITMLLRIYRRQTRRKPKDSSPPAGRHAGRDSRGLRAGAPDSIVRWEVEMQELGRDLKAEIESKMVALGHLIRDADRAAERLERALASDARTLADSDRIEERQPSDPQDSGDLALRSEVFTLADYGFSIAHIASRLATPVGQVKFILQHREERK